MNPREIYNRVVNQGQTPEQIKKYVDGEIAKQQVPEVMFTPDWRASQDTSRLVQQLKFNHDEALIRLKNQMAQHPDRVMLNDLSEQIILEKVINLITKGTYAR